MDPSDVKVAEPPPRWSRIARQDGRYVYLDHTTDTLHWLPPTVDEFQRANGTMSHSSSLSSETSLPYGFEKAKSQDGSFYFINHLDQTTCSSLPCPATPQGSQRVPRTVHIVKDARIGFGFVAGSEKPVVVRCVNEEGPSHGKLVAGDEILEVNDISVIDADRENVIKLVKSCNLNIKMKICQPIHDNSERKSALLTIEKKVKLKNNPFHVRFDENILQQTQHCESNSNSIDDFMPNVMKVFLENGQTKSFKYDKTTTVNDVLDSMHSKLELKSHLNFSLVIQNLSSSPQNKLTLLLPTERLSDIASQPSAAYFRCLYRICYFPIDVYEFLRNDNLAFEYLYMQCCNDIVNDRFLCDLKTEVALKLATLHMKEYALTSLNNKISIKTLMKDPGISHFLSHSIIAQIKPRFILRSLQNHHKMGEKLKTSLKLKLEYIKIVSELKSYGNRFYIATHLQKKCEIMLNVNYKWGIYQIINIKTNQKIEMANFTHLNKVLVKRFNQGMLKVTLKSIPPISTTVSLLMLSEDAKDLISLISGYYKIQVDKHKILIEEDTSVDIPKYNSIHMVAPAPWTYVSAVPTSAAAIMRQLDLRGGAGPADIDANTSCNTPGHAHCDSAHAHPDSGHAPCHPGHAPCHSGYAHCESGHAYDTGALVDDEVVLTSIMDSRRMSVEVHASTTSIPTTIPTTITTTITIPTTTTTTASATTTTGSSSSSSGGCGGGGGGGCLEPTLEEELSLTQQPSSDHQHATSCLDVDKIASVGKQQTNSQPSTPLSSTTDVKQHHQHDHQHHHHQHHQHHLLGAHLCSDSPCPAHHAPLASPDMSVISGSDSDIASTCSPSTSAASTTTDGSPTTSTPTTAGTPTHVTPTTTASTPTADSNTPTPCASDSSTTGSHHITTPRSRPASLVLGQVSPLDLDRSFTSPALDHDLSLVDCIDLRFLPPVNERDCSGLLGGSRELTKDSYRDFSQDCNSSVKDINSTQDDDDLISNCSNMSDFNDLPLDIRKQIDLMVTTGTADIKFDDMDKILQGQDVENDSGNETISGENVDISSSVYKPVKLSSELDCLDIDQFIAAMCVPPPPDHRVTDALQACPPTSTDSVVGVVNDTRPDNARLNDFQELQTTTSPPNHINSSPGQTHTTSPAIAHKPAITRAKPILAPLPVTSSTTSANPCEIPAVVETDSVVPLWKQLLTPVTSPSHAPSTPLHAHTDITNSRTTVDGHDQSAIAGADIKVNGPQSGANGVGEHVRDTNSTNSRSVNFKHNGQESEQKYNGVQVVTCSSIVGERLAAINNATRDRLPPGHDSHTTNGFTPHPRLNGSASELNDSRCRDDRLQYSSCSGSSPASRLNSCANDSGIQSRNRSQTSEGDTLPLTPEELALLEATPPFLVTPTAAAATTTTVVYDTPTPVETCVVMRRKNKSPPITPTHYSAIVNAYAEPANDVLNSSPTSCQTLSRRSGGQTSLVDPHYSTLPHFPRNHHSTSEIPPPLEEQRIAREPRIRHKAPVPPRRYSSLECDQVAGRSQTQRSAPNSTRHAPSVGHAHKPAPPPRRGSKLLRDSEIIYDKPQLNHQGPISPCTSTSSTSSSNYQNNNGYCSVTLRKNRSRSIDRRKFSSFFAEDDDSLSNMSMTSSMTSHGSTEEITVF